ncbi:MAG: chromate transporter [Clostridium sp.]
MEMLFLLFVTFFKIGSFSFGGGYAMLPFMEREVVINNNMIDMAGFMDIIGISQMTPGPVSINSATFIGYKMSGVFGSIAATSGVVITSFTLCIIVSKMINKFKDSAIIKGSLTVMRPVLVALVVQAFLNLAVESYLNYKSIIIGVIIAIALFYKKVNPILLIGVSAMLGLLFWG